jgi:hypothetical protein
VDPWHLCFFLVSCVEWVCVVVRVRLQQVAAAWPELGLWPEIESWWAIASTSFVEYRLEA